jgi:transcription elongation GreA/GreB family factor
VGKYESFKDWAELPPLTTVLTHAIALGEGRQSGETLKMQNIVRRLFANVDWLRKVLGWMTPSEQVLFFERFQASIAWDHSMHHTIVVRMTKIAPVLEASLVRAEKKREYARVTSVRSFEARKREYNKLINEEMPANVKRIEFAKSYGDLSENAEYQYAKDEQRVLMQKQTVMQAELDAVKAGDFADATTDEVMPGVEVVVAAKDGERKYVILGEWDNDLERGIISSQTRVAKNLMGKKVGDKFELPDAEGNVELASVKEILPLSDDVKAWMKI